MVAHALTHLKTHAYPGEPITLDQKVEGSNPSSPANYM